MIVAEKTPKYEEQNTFNFDLRTTNINNGYMENNNIRNIEIERDNRRSTSNSSLSDMTEALDEAINHVTHHQRESRVIVVDEEPSNLSQYLSKIIVMGNSETIRTMSSLLRQQGAKNILGCQISYKGGIRQYEEMLQDISVGDEVVFVWAIETETGDIDEDLIGVFKDFLSIFASDSIRSMVVVLWYPGPLEDLRESIEDLTDIMQRNYHYNSSLGFPVLKYSTDSYFTGSLIKKMYEIQPFKITNISMSQNKVEKVKKTVTKSEEIEIVSTEHFEDHESIEKDEYDDEDNLVEDPVVLMVGPPGHGKSSVGNLILGGDYFQIRGKNVFQQESIVHKGYLQRNQVYATVVEAPGFYQDNFDVKSRQNAEFELRKVGHITHIVVTWMSLELRESDMDFVLAEIIKLFGMRALELLIFAVTYCDTSSKAKKYRTNRGITFDSVAKMITGKVQNVFNTDEIPLIYFLCSKLSKDPTRKHIVNYLTSDQWKILPMSKMASWTNETIIVKERVREEDNYEEVEEEVFLADKSSKTTSKSMYNLATVPQNNLSNSNENLSKSMHTVNDNNNSLSSRGKGRLFSTSDKRTSSIGSSSVRKRAMSGGKGRNKNRNSLFGGRSRSNSRSNMDVQESQQNLYRESGSMQDIGSAPDLSENTLTRDRASSRSRGTPRRVQSGLFGTRSRSRSRSTIMKSKSNIALDASRSSLQTSQRNVNDEDDVNGTLDNSISGNKGRQYRRQRSGGSMSSLARKRGRSKSRERPRARAGARGRQSRSLPRPEQDEAEDVQRAPMSRSKSNWSVKSSNNRRRRKSGDCSIM